MPVLPLHHHRDMKRPLVSQGLGVAVFLGNAHNGSVMPSEIPTGQSVGSSLIARLGQAI